MSAVISAAGLWVGDPEVTQAPTRADIVARCLADALAGSDQPALGSGDFVVNVSQLPHDGTPGVNEAFHGPDPLRVLPAGVSWVTLGHACASVLFALRLAAALIDRGRYERIAVIGALVPTAPDVDGMRALRALGSGQARPFALDRDGTSLGRGGGVLVIESANAQRLRRQRPVARLLSVDARIVAEQRAGSDSAAIERCIVGALQSAGTRHIDVVEAHATGTVLGDEAELTALERVGTRLGWRAVPVRASKGVTGHLLQAAGLPSVVAACHGLRGGTGSVTVDQLSPGLPAGLALDVGGTPTIQRKESYALVDAFGFSGNYAAAVLSLDATDDRPDIALPPLERTPW